MAGNPANVHLWIEADVLVYNAATLPTADLPAAVTDPFVTTTGKWSYVGLLVGDDGIDIQREWEETDIPAWGYGTIIVGSKNFKSSAKVSAREDNAAVQSILWPGSTDSDIVVPDPSSQFVAIEKRGSFGEVARLITKRPARLWIPNDKTVEGNNSPYEMNIRFFPNSAMELFLAQSSDGSAASDGYSGYGYVDAG
jgi:hypothetical protein